MTSYTESLTFGDIIEHIAKGDQYVFLSSTIDFVYIAKILSDYETKQLVKMHEIHLKKGGPTDEMPAFWFVRLTCEEFKDQAAHLLNAQKSADDYRYFKKCDWVKLNKSDLLALKKEILEKRTWPDLKENIKDIQI